MIKMLICDCDGTLTDGTYTVFDSGTISKNFFTRDFYGLQLLNDRGIKVVVVTLASDGIIQKRCKRIAPYVQVCTVGKDQDKMEFVAEKFKSYDWGEIAFIGDDVFDSKLLNKVGLAACPLDADPHIIELVENHPDGFVSRFVGGRGAVRDFTDYILGV